MSPGATVTQREIIAPQDIAVQRLSTRLAIVFNASTTPQPRKPTHTIITATIKAASNPIMTFLLVRGDEERNLILGSFRPIGRRLFICLSQLIERSVIPKEEVSNLKAGST
jgi:hypothetical protein